jgi:hypothetical protein
MEEANMDTKIQRNYLDRLFNFIFGREEHKDWTLSLYNAVNGSHYTDPDLIEFNTVEDMLYMGMQNDTSFLISDIMSVYEHQSSYNPNMPLRMLGYTDELYAGYVTKHRLNKYGSAQLQLPVPRLVVFYNGEEDTEDEVILKLSDSFPEGLRSESDIEIRVGFSEEFTYFDISVWDFETVLRYRLHVKGYDSGRIEEYEGDEERFEYVIHLDNGDDILISSIDDPSREESMLAGVKYVINTTLSTDNTACNAFVSVMGEMFVEPYDQETSEHINKLNSECIHKLTENEEGSFTCEHMKFSYESLDPSAEVPNYAIEIVPAV